MPGKRKTPSKRVTKRRTATFDDVRLAAQTFPGIEDSTSYGTPAIKVRGKLLARLHQSGECFVLRQELLDREILLQSNPNVFYLTDHYRDHPWILTPIKDDSRFWCRCVEFSLLQSSRDVAGLQFSDPR